MYYESGAALDGVRLVNAILEFPFRKHAATFCSLASGAGTLFAGKCLHKMSTNGSAESALTTAAIGMAVSSLSLVGSAAWMLETGAFIAGCQLVNAIEEFPFRKHLATFCSLVSGAGTLFAGNYLYEMSTNDSAESSLTTAAIGMAVSSLSLVGSAAWFLYERSRHRAFMERRKSQNLVPYLIAGRSSDKKSAAVMQEAVDHLNKIIACVDTTLEDKPKEDSNSDEVRTRVQLKTTTRKSNDCCKKDF